MMPQTLPIRVIFLIAALSWSAPALCAQTWDRYKPGTLAAVIQRHETSIRERGSTDRPLYEVSMQDFATRAILVYTSQHRPLAPERRELLRYWSTAAKAWVPADFITRFENEYLFREDTLQLWVAVQSVLEPHLAREARPGRPLTAFVMFVGAHYAGAEITWLFLMNGFDADAP